MRVLYAIALYLVIFVLFHLAYGALRAGPAIISMPDMPEAAYALLVLGVVMAQEGIVILLPLGLSAALAGAALIRWRRRGGWALLSLALFVLQLGGLAGVHLMGSV